ncbi:hypothetical protein ACFQY0_20670 [Haloferula chungangensis]|uniref:Uncharacterized protein n=1 Tax=Haloferula chungangensis TaxID=1048331 RepID=A0ABW2LAX7_9BACT
MLQEYHSASGLPRSGRYSLVQRPIPEVSEMRLNGENRVLAVMKLEPAWTIRTILIAAILGALGCSDSEGDAQVDDKQTSSIEADPSGKTTDGMEFVDLPVPQSVVFCRPEPQGFESDPFERQDISASPDLVERWSRTTKDLKIDHILGENLREQIRESGKDRLSSYFGVGYRDGAILLDGEKKPIFAILRLKKSGYYRFSAKIVADPSGYAIDLGRVQNMVFVKGGDFDDLLWKPVLVDVDP